MIRRITLVGVIITIVITGCATVPSVSERIAAAQALAAAANMAPFIAGSSAGGVHALVGSADVPGTARPPGPAIPLHGFARLSRQGADLTVYIEGDGRAWINRTLPSPNPTPINPVGLYLAAQDRSANVVYLARPGQYAGTAAGTDSRYWLAARFAPAVIDAYEAAVRELAITHQAPAVHLVGYSGGAAVAALLAARLQAEHKIPVTLRTIAGNLDIAAWTRLKRITPLAGSLNPADVAAALRDVPQLHLTGTRDRQVPHVVLDAFLARLPTQRCVRVIDVDTGHAGPWQAVWQQVLMQPLACRN